jgi:hypothetical protein
MVLNQVPPCDIEELQGCDCEASSSGQEQEAFVEPLGSLDHVSGCQRHSKTKLISERPSGSSPLRSEILKIGRRQAGPRKQWPKTLKRRVGKQLKEVRDLLQNRHGDSLKKSQLTLSQGMMKKGNLSSSLLLMMVR